MAAPAKSKQRIALGAAVRELREQQEMSQEDLAFAAESHRNYIGRIERGEQSPSFEHVIRIAAALEVSLQALIERYEQKLG